MFHPRFAATDSDWAERMLPFVDELLVEQAHLEKKAASAAIHYLFRYPELAPVHDRLSELAREELEHFERVLALCRRRGIAFGALKPGTYPGRLQAIQRAREPDLLLDRLLCNAVIEARSCERMKLLGEALRERDDEVADFYGDLVRSEARHHDLYVRIAKTVVDPSVVDTRLVEILEHEGDVLATSPPGPPRLHA